MIRSSGLQDSPDTRARLAPQVLRALIDERLKRQAVDSAGISASREEVVRALTRFAQVEPQKAELVKLRYFVGLTIEETAAALGISPATAKRHWAYSKAWLFQAMGGGEKNFENP